MNDNERAEKARYHTDKAVAHLRELQRNWAPMRGVCQWSIDRLLSERPPFHELPEAVYELHGPDGAMIVGESPEDLLEFIDRMADPDA